MRGLYRIAEKNIEIVSLFEDVQELCRDYRTEGEAELRVTVTPEEIALEREKADRAYPDAYLETLAVYRKIAEACPAWDTLLVHGSAVAADGEGYLFAAPSGTGKSTHARLWRELLGERAVMINDDKPLLRIGERVTVFGTPWNGKHRLGENTQVPLRAVCFVERAPENTIAPIGAEEAWPRLLAQTYRPENAAAMRKTLRLLDELSRRVRFYRLRCNMDPSAAELSYQTMSKEREA